MKKILLLTLIFSATTNSWAPDGKLLEVDQESVADVEEQKKHKEPTERTFMDRLFGGKKTEAKSGEPRKRWSLFERKKGVTADPESDAGAGSTAVEEGGESQGEAVNVEDTKNLRSLSFFDKNSDWLKSRSKRIADHIKNAKDTTLNINDRTSSYKQAHDLFSRANSVDKIDASTGYDLRENLINARKELNDNFYSNDENVLPDISSNNFKEKSDQIKNPEKVKKSWFSGWGKGKDGNNTMAGGLSPEEAIKEHTDKDGEKIEAYVKSGKLSDRGQLALDRFTDMSNTTNEYYGSTPEQKANIEDSIERLRLTEEQVTAEVTKNDINEVIKKLKKKLESAEDPLRHAKAAIDPSGLAAEVILGGTTGGTGIEPITNTNNMVKINNYDDDSGVRAIEINTDLQSFIKEHKVIKILKGDPLQNIKEGKRSSEYLEKSKKLKILQERVEKEIYDGYYVDFNKRTLEKIKNITVKK